MSNVHDGNHDFEGITLTTRKKGGSVPHSEAIRDSIVLFRGGESNMDAIEAKSPS
jgi:hypothetical protein